MTSGRDGKRRHARVGAHEDAVRDGKWLSGDFELLWIKRYGQEASASRVNQVARRRVTRARTAANEDPLFPCVERQDADISVVIRVAIRHPDREKNRLPRWKK